MYSKNVHSKVLLQICGRKVQRNTDVAWTTQNNLKKQSSGQKKKKIQIQINAVHWTLY